MEKRNIVVIGASAGGFEALKQIVAALPPHLDASIFVVWHMGADVRGILPDVFNKLNTIHAAQAYDGETIKGNRIYVAPPDHHLIIEDGHLRVTRGPKENRFRPAIDPLFRSAAYSYGNRVIGVVLSGALDDGTAGLWRIKFGGGLTVVQDPADAAVRSMPESAMRAVDIDHCVPISQMANLLAKLVKEEIDEKNNPQKDEKTKAEINIARANNTLQKGSLAIGELSPYACPECHGVLSKIVEGNVTRFRCHTGHAYSTDTLMASITEKIEDSLYDAIRGMDETILFLNHLGDHYAEVNQPKVAANYFNKAKEVASRSELVRKVIKDHEQLTKEKLASDAQKEPTI